MGKITFRADDDLVDELEAFDASKSEVMREALRSYLDGQSRDGPRAEPRDHGRERSPGNRSPSFEELLTARIDERLEQRLADYRHTHASERPEPQDVNVTVTLEGAGEHVRKTDATNEAQSLESPAGPTEPSRQQTTDAECRQCGEHVDDEHVHCPNCGEKTSHRLFCDCGDEIRSDWAFCPACGRRTAAADVLDSR